MLMRNLTKNQERVKRCFRGGGALIIISRTLKVKVKNLKFIVYIVLIWKPNRIYGEKTTKYEQIVLYNLLKKHENTAD